MSRLLFSMVTVANRIKGETVDPEKPIIYTSYRAYLSSEMSRKFVMVISMSCNDVETLPTNMNHGMLLTKGYTSLETKPNLTDADYLCLLVRFRPVKYCPFRI